MSEEQNEVLAQQQYLLERRMYRLDPAPPKLPTQEYIIRYLPEKEDKYGWLRYPKDPSEFRLAVERKLSSWWDEEAAYACETLGDISFEYDEYAEAANGALWADPESPFRVKKYDPATKGFTILKSSEVQKMYETVQREMREIEHKIAAHLAEMPTAQDASSVSDGLPWIKTLYELCDRKDIIEDVLENL